MAANPNIVWIDPDVCEKCMTCVEEFGCPAIQRGVSTDPAKPGFVPWIHAELCNGNGSCIQVCPLGAIKRPTAVRFGRTTTPLEEGEETGGGVEGGGEGYQGGPTVRTKGDVAGEDAEACK